jgi:hypothetical protein
MNRTFVGRAVMFILKLKDVGSNSREVLFFKVRQMKGECDQIALRSLGINELLPARAVLLLNGCQYAST